MAAIAANNDKEIGQMLADAMKKVGKDGVITLEEGRQVQIESDLVEGMQFDRGYLSPHFVTNLDGQLRNGKPVILIYEEKICSVKSLIPLLEKISKNNLSLLIIAEDLEGEALATLVVNKLRGILKICAVKAPGYGDRRKAMLEDIAVLTGGKAIFKDLGIQLENIELSDLGVAKKIQIDAENTTIIQGSGTKAAIEGRAEIRKEITKTDSEYDREKLQERLAKLAGGVAQIKVGAAHGNGDEGTQGSRGRRARRHEGRHRRRRRPRRRGGLAAVHGRGRKDEARRRREARSQLVRGVLEMPIRTIAENAGSTARRGEQREEAEGQGSRLHALNDRYGDMFEFGVVDPTKVVRSALQNAASVACLLLTTESIVVEEPKAPEADGHHDHHGDGGMGGMGGMGMGGMGGMGEWEEWEEWEEWAWAAWVVWATSNRRSTIACA